MTTRLDKPVLRVVVIFGRGRAVPRPHIAEMSAAGVRLREKGRRTWYGPVAWTTILHKGALLAAEQLARERKAKREARKLARG